MSKPGDFPEDFGLCLSSGAFAGIAIGRSTEICVDAAGRSVVVSSTATYATSTKNSI
jgi:hypothetical protein